MLSLTEVTSPSFGRDLRRERAGSGPSSKLDPATLAVLEAVGLDFLAQPGAAYISDNRGRVLWGNAAWHELAAERFVAGGGPIDYIPWPVEELSLPHMPGSLHSIEHSYPTREGGQILRSQHWRAVDAQGTVLGFAGLVQLPAAEDRLRSQIGKLRERLDDLTRLVSDGIWEMTAMAEFSSVSPRVSELAGYHAREMLNKRLEEFGCFVDAAGHQVASPLDAERPQPFRDRAFILRDAHGHSRHLRLAGLPIFDEQGRFNGYRGTARDVTGEALALGLVAQSRSQLTQAIESINEGFALFDSNARLLLWNKHYLAAIPNTAPSVHVGITHQQITSMAYARGDIAAADSQEQTCALDIIGRAKRQITFDFQLADGRWLRASDRFTADGSIVGIRTDITEVKRRETSLLHAKEAAEDANRAKSEFLANVSHELRTPLNAIIGFSEFMLAEAIGPIGNQQYKAYLQDILTSGQHLLLVINDILDLARAESGTLKLNTEVLDIAELIENVLRPMRERALRAELRLTSKAEVDLPTIKADPRKLRQILLNLVSNAIKFTPKQGTVTVTASRGDQGSLVLRVIDTGIGMSKSDIDIAFAPFGQVDGRLNRRYEGTGLGLPLTRAIVELHGGAIEIDSTPGTGTAVTLRLPSRVKSPSSKQGRGSRSARKA